MSSSPAPYLILMPAYNDWESVRSLVPMLERELSQDGLRADLLIIDDGSAVEAPADLIPAVRALGEVRVLTLRRNLGHQRAICVGLCALAADESLGAVRGVVVMDGDGEDAPADVPRLIRAFEEQRGDTAVFAERLRRSEGIVFTAFYHLYRIAHHILSGVPVRIGNFSVMPMRQVRRLAVVSELWNHYAAAVVQAKVPMVRLPTSRASRLAGTSKMNFVALVSHGLAAMSVFGDRIGVRALIASLVLILSLGAGIVGLVTAALVSGTVFPVWAKIAMGVTTVLITQFLLLSLVFTFLIQFGRSASGFLPARDYGWFIDSLRVLRQRS